MTIAARAGSRLERAPGLAPRAGGERVTSGDETGALTTGTSATLRSRGARAIRAAPYPVSAELRAGVSRDGAAAHPGPQAGACRGPGTRRGGGERSRRRLGLWLPRGTGTGSLSAVGSICRPRHRRAATGILAIVQSSSRYRSREVSTGTPLLITPRSKSRSLRGRSSLSRRRAATGAARGGASSPKALSAVAGRADFGFSLRNPALVGWTHSGRRGGGRQPAATDRRRRACATGGRLDRAGPDSRVGS